MRWAYRKHLTRITATREKNFLGKERRHVAKNQMPSTRIMSVWEVAWRRALGAAYSGECHQLRAISADGNSTMTMRRCGQFPSRTSILPPRTRKRPPYFSIVGRTDLR